MDPKRTIDDKFSKLHPSFPVDTRIGIVGAGPSGLSAAYALAKLGYLNVTLFEKCHTVSGMCESIDIEGRTYDLGGQVIAANSAPVITHLAKELGSDFEEMDTHKLALIDSQTGNIRDLEVAEDYVSMVSLTLKLQEEANKSGRAGLHALSGLASEPTLEFLKQNGINSMPKSVAYGYTASGYGFVQDMPYAFIQEFTRTSMAGKIRRFKHGYMSMWEKLSQSLPFEVFCDTEVLNVKRNSCGANVTVKNNDGEKQVMEFDKIILSGALPFKNGKTYRSSSLTDGESEVVELHNLERELFSKVQTIDYYTTVVKINGFENIPKGFYYFGEFMEDPTTIGHPVAMQRFYADTNIFLFWSYGNSADIKGSFVAKCVTNVVSSMGGSVQNVILQRRFKYFPHVSSKDMKDGFYERLESELQGCQNTYYVGGLLAFELTERNASYSITTVCKHFAIDGEQKMSPYVKRLFPLSSNPSSPRDLGELEGVEFPDLPSLDGYLQYWGTHKVTEKNVIYTWINEEGKIMNRRTYKELHGNASHIAQNLLTSTKPVIKPGDRVLLIHLPGLEFIDAFFGCIRAGVIPVPVLPPDPMQSGGQALLKVENISKMCNAVAILSTTSYHAAVRAGYIKSLVTLAKRTQKCSAQWPDIPWIHTDSWIKNYQRSLDSFNSDNIVFTKPQPSDLCFLQFTSGSTGDAKGVMITHGGLIHNVKMMKKRYRSTSKTVLVSWLPQYHDMGLIGGLFTALVSGGTSILFSPMTFIRNPLLWLQTINDYHGTHSAGPNFSFELVIRRLEVEKNKVYDLSSMVFLMIAAEPVRQKTIRRFIELTQPFGLSEGVLAPGYGLAENCVYVTCAFGECKPVYIDWQGRVCCGYVEQNDADTLIRIVDPDSLTVHQDGVEGEIWISSPSSGVGYWGNSEMSQKTFCNQLKNHPNKKFTRTGDLGRIIDGKLFITGRIKDLIIVAGRNIYSADVEKTVESSSEALRPGCCAVVGIPEEVLAQKGISIPDSSDQVGLVVIAEVREGKAASEEVVNNIKARVVEEHGVAVASVKLIKPRTICKTTSGKIRRFECMRQFVDNTLSLANVNNISKRKGLFRSLTTGTGMEVRRPSLRQTADLTISPRPKTQVKKSSEITEFLTLIVSEQTGIPKDKISPTDSLPSYGFDSIAVVRAAQKLSDFLGVPVGAIDIFTASCISDLSNFLENLVHKSQPQLAPWPKSNVKNSREIIEFLTYIVSDHTGIPKDKISPTDSLPSYGFDSIAVVQAAQKLSDFLDVPVGAIDIFTASCISELAAFLENLAHKSQSHTQLAPDASCFIEDETQVVPMDAISPEFSILATGVLQLLALTYVCFMLLLPAYLASSAYISIFSTVKSPLLSYLSSLVMAPIAWIFYISLTSLSLSILGKSFLQPNYVLIPDVSIWSVDFVKWWALNKAQALAAKVLAVHLKGTIFLNYWFKMQGARIGSSVVIDTVDITDPSLLTVADGAVLAEGVLVQGHEVCSEVLSFRHIKIGREASIGPYAVLQKGTIVEDGLVVPPLQKTESGKSTHRTIRTSVSLKEKTTKGNMMLEHLASIYAVGILGALSSAIVYTLYAHFSGTAASPRHFSFACIAGAFHWLPAAITAYAVIVQETPTSASTFALLTAFAYLSYGVILSLLTSVAIKALAAIHGTKQLDDSLASLIHRRIAVAAHVRFAKMLSGTEAFCVYLRLLGAKIGRHCSIRAINPVANPELVSVGDGVHLGDFCNIVPGFYSKGGFTGAEIKVQENAVVGSGSLLLPGCVLQVNVILGALSVAPENAVLQRGGVYVGSRSLTMVKNTLLEEDERIEEMDRAYKKIVGNLAANLAITTMNVKSRYFHRIGVSGRGVLRMYGEIPSLPRHKIFGAGKSFPVIVRHSNSLSADDDARLDARGAAVRILSDDGEQVPLLDLTLKSGKAFYARTIADFATWLVCGLPAREEQVKRSPHIRDAVWGSLRSTDSYAVLHYYSNICRLLRFDDGEEMYAKFKLRPADPDVSEDSGKVVPRGILPPETGAIPRDEGDTRPLLFLADDFRRRVDSPDGVRYVLQLQLREVPPDGAARDVALDCTQPWDEAEFPYIDVGEVSIDRNVPTEETEKLEFNPFLRCPEVDVIPATSCTQSASIDHGRSLVYEICQRLRNGEPLPASWRAFLEQSDTKIDLSGCPVAAAATPTRSSAGDATKVTLARTWYQALWATLCQPLLQTLVPYSALGLVIFLPLQGLLAVAAATDAPLYWLLPVFWAASGIAAMATCAASKWALVGGRGDGDTVHIWSPAVFLDTVWQAVRTATAEYFAELTSGSVLFAAWMWLMGSSVHPVDAPYVDSMGALLNPEMVHLERGASVGRDALLFGHVYEGEAGKVKFGAVRVGEDGFVGSRAVAMPGVRVDDGGCLGALGLAMKGETVKHSM
ncbi:uncharacterized protein LOC102705529 [Oryza brachyantha]|uniref:uncharacterized protein LOC102705529 n=1 Tax=Oryza brachyantha TaxID=4533 RepID=UPI001ADCA918|nr:uncharacterized protein LOC102705529 [Oryza brachyantha]